jgi:hypothetical protein
MFPAKRVGFVRNDTPRPFDDRVRIEPFSGQNAFPTSLIIENLLWLDMPLVDCTLKVLKLACNNTIGSESPTALVTG